ncbi:MAG: hypothetical protein ACI9KE_004224 [Polyangiales bacterium]|jgi:hypothetical protein
MHYEGLGGVDSLEARHVMQHLNEHQEVKRWLGKRSVSVAAASLAAVPSLASSIAMPALMKKAKLP